jgi:uracil phosphoribosyltransferase
MNVIELKHPLIEHKLTLLRDEKTGTKEFRELIGEISTVLCYEAMKDVKLKTVEIKKGENKYKCQIQIIKNFIQVSLYIDNILKSQGNIHISKIQYQIYALADYTINEIFEEINILNNDNFNIIKDNNNKYKLKIKFIILRKNKYLYIDLIENEQNINNNDLINTITELKEIIKNKDQKIKLLEDELNKYKSLNNNNAQQY